MGSHVNEVSNVSLISVNDGPIPTKREGSHAWIEPLSYSPTKAAAVRISADQEPSHKCRLCQLLLSFSDAGP